MTIQNGMDIHVVCFAGSLDTDLLPHFLAHYRGLGARKFHFVLHGKFTSEAISNLMAQDDVEIEDRVYEPYGDFLQSSRVNKVLRKLHGKWVFHVDVDEFVELPYRTTGRTIAALEVFGCDALPAYMLQRVSANGALAALPADGDIWEVYPKAEFNLSERMGVDRAIWKTKFPLFLVGDKTVRKRGNHLPPNDWPAERAPLRAVVHHFKWRDALLKSLKNERQEESGTHEYDAYGDWLSSHDNRLPIEHARELAQDDFFRIGLMARADRQNLRVYSLLRKIRTSRDAPNFPSPNLRRMAESLFESRTNEEANSGGKTVVSPRGLFARPGKVCFVSFELVGPTNTGGIGTAISALAEALSAFGHDVHVLFCPHMGYGMLHELWHEMWNSRGVTLHYLPQRTSMEMPEPPRQQVCRDVARYLSDQSFDLIHFHENGGVGNHVAQLSKSTAAFAKTKICVSTHGPQAWHKQGNLDTWWQSEVDIAEMEMSMMRSADLVLSPSQYMLDWIGENMVELANGVVVRNVLPGSSRLFRQRVGSHRPVDEIVFFGRLETRKGLDRFLKAIEHLTEIGSPPFSLTFLGRVADQKHAVEVDEMCRKHGIRYEIISNLGTVEAVNYLRFANCVVVIPSRLDNLPYTIYECLENGIPIITSSIGGIPELIPSAEHPDVLRADDPKQLATALSQLLLNGSTPGSLAFDSALVELENIAIHSQLVDDAATIDVRAPDLSGVTVVVYGDKASGVSELFVDRLNAWVADGVGAIVLPSHMKAEHIHGANLKPEGSSDIRSYFGDDDGFLADVAALQNDHVIVYCHTQVIADDSALRSMVVMVNAADADAVVVGYRFGTLDSTGSSIAKTSDEILPLALPRSSAAGQNIFGTGLFAVKLNEGNKIKLQNLIDGDREFFHWKYLNQVVAGKGEVLAIPSALATRIVSGADCWDDRVTREHWNDLLSPWTGRVPPHMRPAICLAAERQAVRTSDVDHLRNFLNDEDQRSLTDEDTWLFLVKGNNWLADMFRYGYAMEIKHVSDALKNTSIGRAVRRPGVLRNILGLIFD